MARAHSTSPAPQRGWKVQPGGGAAAKGISPMILGRMPRRVRLGRGLAQHIGIRVQRRAQHLGHRAMFNDAAEIHHRHAAAEPAHHREVMADEEKGGPPPLTQFAQQQHLRLHQDIKCRDRLIGHDQFQVHAQRAGNADALALAAGEFMRLALQRIGWPDNRDGVPARQFTPKH